MIGFKVMMRLSDGELVSYYHSEMSKVYKPGEATVDAVKPTYLFREENDAMRMAANSYTTGIRNRAEVWKCDYDPHVIDIALSRLHWFHEKGMEEWWRLITADYVAAKKNNKHPRVVADIRPSNEVVWCHEGTVLASYVKPVELLYAAMPWPETDNALRPFTTNGTIFGDLAWEHRQLTKLQGSAESAALNRRHDMGDWEYINSSKAINYCLECGMYVMVNIRPMPNEIDIGGSAVARECDKTSKEGEE